MKNPVVKKKNKKKDEFNQFYSLHGSCITYPEVEHTSNNRLAIPCSKRFKNIGLRIVRTL